MADEETAPNARIRANIRAQVFDATHEAVEDKVEAGKDAARQGDGSFWGWLKSIFFQLAEALGIESWVARLTGSPIPEKQEITALSASVADTVSATLTDKDFQYANRHDFEDGLKNRIFEDLSSRAAEMPSFSKEQMEAAAAQTAARVQQQFAGLFDADGNVVPGANAILLSPVDSMASTQLSEALSANDPKAQKSLNALAGKELEPADRDIIAAALASKLTDLHGARLDELRTLGDGAFAKVSEELRTTLLEKKDAINAAGGMKFTDAGSAALGDEIAKGFVKEKLKIETPPQDFTAAAESRKQAAINEAVESQVSEMTAEKIRSNTVLGVLAAYKTSTVAAIPIPDAPADIVAKYYRVKNDANGTPYDGTKAEHYQRNNVADEKNELPKAEQKLLDFAANGHRSLNDRQRRKTGEIVGRAVKKTLGELQGTLGDTEQDKQKLAEALQKNIHAALNESKGELDRLGVVHGGFDNTIDNINSKNSPWRGPSYDLFAEISKGVAKTVADNEDGAFTQLAEAQNALVESKTAAQELRSNPLATTLGIRHDDVPLPNNGDFVGSAPGTPPGQKTIRTGPDTFV